MPLILTSLLFMVSACTLDEPGGEGFGKYDTNPTPKDVGGAGDQRIACDGTSAPAAPVPSPTPPSQYAHKILPIRGTATGAGMVGAKATTGQATPATVGSTGKFCIEVDLAVGDNDIQLYSLGKSGCQGRMSPSYKVRYTPVSAPDMGIAKPTNLAKGKNIISNTAPNSGSNSYAIDGSLSSVVRYEFSDIEISETCDQCAWIRVDLGKAYVVSKFRVRWAQGETTEFARWFKILTAKSTPAKNPDCKVNAGWVNTHEETSGIAVPKDITVQPVTTRYAVLQMCENAGGDWMGRENFKLAEFEVWGVDSGATTPPKPDRCQ